MKVEKQFKRTVKAGLILFAVGLLLGAVIVYAVTPSSTFYISSGVYPGAPSYTIWEEDSNYFAKDANGELKYSGTNPREIIYYITGWDGIDSYNNLAACPAITLYFKKGLYPIDKNIYFNCIASTSDGGNITLLAEEGTIFQATTSLETNGKTIFTFYAGENIKIEGFTFDLQNKNVTRVAYFGLFAATNNVEISNCRFINGLNPTASLWYLAYAIQTIHGNNYDIHHNYFNNYWIGCDIENTGGYVSQVKIHHNIFESCGVSVVFEGTAATPQYLTKDHIITDNIFNGTNPRVNQQIAAINIQQYYWNNTNFIISRNIVVYPTGQNASGIRLSSVSYSIISNNIVNNSDYSAGDFYGGISLRGTQKCKILGNIVDNSYLGIQEINHTGFNDADYNTITDNTISDITTLVLEVVGAHSIAKDNILDTPNWGTATLANGQTFVNVTVGYLASTNDLIFLQIIEATSLATGEYLRVDTIFAADNIFKVECGDGGAASTDIVFAYEVTNRG